MGTRFCYHGGLTKSFCEAGLCMCKFGYEVEKEDDGSSTCVSADSELAAAVARNATQEEINLLMEHKEHSERMVAQNLAIATAWICGAASFAVAASVWFSPPQFQGGDPAGRLR